MDKKEKYTIKSLEFIKNIISRLNNNSFNIKLFSVTIFGVLVTLYIENNNILYIFICALCLTMLVILDSVFLFKERKFIRIYDNIIDSSKNKDLKVFKYKTNDVKNISFLNTFFSFSIIIMYLSMLIPLVAIIIIYYLK